MAIYIVIKEPCCHIDTKAKAETYDIRYVTDSKDKALIYVFNHRFDDRDDCLAENPKYEDLINVSFVIEAYEVDREFSGKLYNKAEITKMFCDGTLKQALVKSYLHEL